MLILHLRLKKVSLLCEFGREEAGRNTKGKNRGILKFGIREQSRRNLGYIRSPSSGEFVVCVQRKSLIVACTMNV
jgi:hypothetical protein